MIALSPANHNDYLEKRGQGVWDWEGKDWGNTSADARMYDWIPYKLMIYIIYIYEYYIGLYLIYINLKIKLILYRSTHRVEEAGCNNLIL